MRFNSTNKISILLILLLISCSKNDNSTNPKLTHDFIPIPLKVGNSWIYKETVSTGFSQFKFSIIDTLTFSNQKVYQLDNDWLFDKNGCYYKDGILYGFYIDNSSTSNEILFPKNPSIEQTWSFEGYSLKLIAKDVSITVPAGTFSCYKVNTTLILNNTTYETFNTYWSDGKGIIRFGDKSDESYAELVTIQLN